MVDKIGVIYFSGTGNTKFVAENIKLELESYNEKVDLINIEKDKMDMTNYKSLIIGGPIYVDRYPEILIEYMDKYLKGYKRKCMLFSTQGSSKESIAFQHCINRLPYLNITYCMIVPMPNNFYNFMSKMSSKSEENKYLTKAQLLIKSNLKAFMNNHTKTFSKNKFYVTTINSVYYLVYPYYARFLNSKITIDKDRCTRCKLCENRCPVNAIKITDRVTFNRNCLLCQRCLNSCPNNAFLYKGKNIIQYKPNFNKVSNK